MAKAAGASADTVSRGAGELEAGIASDGRVRRKGGGRPAVEEADPGLVPALEALVDPESRGARSRRCGGRPSPRRIWLVSWRRRGTR